jgi:hypothetical protein
MAFGIVAQCLTRQSPLAISHVAFSHSAKESLQDECGEKEPQQLEPISKLKYDTLLASCERHGINELRYFREFCMLFAVAARGSPCVLFENRL